MNLFQLVIKQMRQRALGTWLTLLSVTLGVGLAITILILYREAGSLFGQTDYGYDVIVGKQGSDIQLVTNTVYHMGISGGNIPYSMYERMLNPDRNQPAAKQHKSRSLFGAAPTTGPANYFGFARIAIPYTVGDTYQGKYRIIGTTTNLFGIDNETGKPLDPEHTIDYRPGHKYEFAEGHSFAPMKFEAVVGSDVARLTDLKIGKEFQATHGESAPTANPDIHPEKWKVVGVLKQTHTASDACVFIPILSSYTVEDHELGLKAHWILQNHGKAPPVDADPDEVHAYAMNPDGTFRLFVPKEYWEISAILVKSRSEISASQLIYALNNTNEVMAVNPAGVMRSFFDTFLNGPTLVLLVVALLVTIVAAVGILVSIYNSVSARMREIAIMRALGATRARVLLLICVEAGLIGLFGGILGLIGGHLMGAVASAGFNRYIGQSINWMFVDHYEMYYLASVVVVALLAGLVPAMKAYRTPVATNLVVV